MQRRGWGFCSSTWCAHAGAGIQRAAGVPGRSLARPRGAPLSSHQPVYVHLCQSGLACRCTTSGVEKFPTVAGSTSRRLCRTSTAKTLVQVDKGSCLSSSSAAVKAAWCSASGLATLVTSHSAESRYEGYATRMRVRAMRRGATRREIAEIAARSVYEERTRNFCRCSLKLFPAISLSRLAVRGSREISCISSADAHSMERRCESGE